MNKKLIALAIATAFAAPVAMADSGNVKISGQLNLSLDSINGAPTAGTDNKRATNVSSNASNIVFGGDEDLGNGLKAVWQVQSYMTLGSGGNLGATNDLLSSGASYAGLSGGFGAVLMGRQEAPFKILSRKVDLFNNQVGDSRNLLSSGAADGSGSTLSTKTLWDLRPGNTIAYASPDMNGFKAVAAYSTNPVPSALAALAATEQSTTATSLNATYENGPVFVGAGYQNIKPNAGAAGETATSAWRLAGGYTFGDAKVVALYQSAKDQSMTTGDDDRKVWGLGASFKMAAADTIKAQYYRAGNYGTTANSGANMWALGVDHAMSKRTTAYVAYSTTRNNSAAAYSATGGGHGDDASTVTGKNPSAFSLGMIHSF